MNGLTDESAIELIYQWRFWARQNQIEPAGDWHIWLLSAGRGFGKTRTGSEWIREQAESGKVKRIALVAETAADGRDVMIQGPSGIMSISHPRFKPVYEPSKRRLTWPNGCIAIIYSAEDPEQLRGQESDCAWADEICKWHYDLDAWDNLMLGLRGGSNPRCVATTTPRRTKLIRRLYESSKKIGSGVVVVHGKTSENVDNLAPSFTRQIISRYQGTRLGRQELDAELLEDTEGALWIRSLLDGMQVERGVSHFKRLVVAIDPPASSSEGAAEAGIVVGGLGQDGIGYLLEDGSSVLAPDAWGRRAVLLYDRHEADLIVAEANNGGEMVAHVIRTAAESLYREKKRKSTHVSFKMVHASRGKRTRAEPVAALCEQGRIKHCGSFPLLEDQLVIWVPGTGEKSPDRLDAYVWLFTELMLDGQPIVSGLEKLKGRTLPMRLTVGSGKRY